MDPVEARVDEIAGGGWWLSTSRRAYLNLARELIAHGLPEDAVFRILRKAYTAAAEEFGN